MRLDYVICIDIERIDKDDNDSRELEANYAVGWGFGSGGGPLWGWISGDPRVIGVWSGSEWEVDPGDRHRVFAGGGPMVELVKHGWTHWQ